MNSVAAWRALHRRDRLIVLEAVAALVLAKLLVHWCPWSLLRAAAGAGGLMSRRRVTKPPRVATLVDGVARHLPLEWRCLERALAVAWILACRGYAPKIVVGTAAGGTRFDAHAWVECDGMPLQASAISMQYAVVAYLGR